MGKQPEDLDDDCQVTVIDIMRVAAQWGQAGGPEDVDGSGTVDVGDVQQVAGAWRETCHVLAETVKYYSLGGQRIAMRKEPAGQAGTLYYLFTDHLGSTSVTYNPATGQTQALRYYPWGGVRSGDVPTDRRFTGQRWDATIGLYFYQARYYDQALGRFVQPDTVVPEPGKPQALNRYAYVYNNPLRYTDPSGHCAYDGSGLCVRYTDDGTPQVVRGGSVFVNPVEEAIANAILSGDPDRLLKAIPEGYNGAFLARTLEAVFKQLGYVDAGIGVGDLLLDPFLIAGLASMGGDLAGDAVGAIGPKPPGLGMMRKGRPPNPYGSRGGPAHTNVVKDIEADIEARGWEPRTEFRVDLLGPGTEGKRFRRVDVAALDVNSGNPVEFHQVGDMTRSGRPIARERRAIIDITEFSEYTDVPLTFWPKRYR